MLKIIQLAGKAGIGKSSFARQLYIELSLQGKKSLILNYGDRLKDVARQVYGWTGIKDEIGRHILQHTGDVGRNIDKDIWIKQVHTLIEFAEVDNFDYIIIGDCRFKNEAKYFKQKKLNYDAPVFRLYRKNFISELTEDAQKHISEIDLDDYKDIIDFELSGNIDNLSNECKQFIEQFCL